MTSEAFEEASDRIRGVAKETKLIHSDFFSEQSGSKVHFKPENLQQTGAYKARGAYYKISVMDESARGKGLITASAGNHTQGVAFAVKLAGVKATACMPTVAPFMKVDRTKALSAEIVLSGDVFDDALKRTYEVAVRTGATFAHPFDDLTVATGQDSIVMEIVKELSTADYTPVSIGGGGLASGVSTLVKLLNPNIHATGVESENAVCMKVSLTVGEAVTLPSANTIADGAAAKRPGKKIFPYIQKNLDGIITIQDSELIVSLLGMAEDHKMIVENSGLLTAAAPKYPGVENEKTVSILSGGNMDVVTMMSLTQHGLIQRDRIFIVSVLLPDKPGQFACVAEAIAKESGNAIKFEHNQLVSINRNAAMEFRITMEAFGTEYKEKICERLKKEGYRPKFVCSKGAYGE